MSVRKFWAIVDLDGTVSDCSARVSLANAAKAETDQTKRGELWDAFHAQCLEDPPHRAEVMIVQAWIAAGGAVCFLTGRTEKFRAETEAWLATQGLPATFLLMRGDRVYTGSLQFKRLMLDRIRETMLDEGEDIAFVMEDQDRLVDQWRELGLTCLQPRRSAFGDYR